MKPVRLTIFFGSPKVRKDLFLDAHFQRTQQRIQETKASTILAIQDSTYLNYTKHPAKIGMGRIGQTGKTTQFGLIHHSTLCITETNECLGLIDLRSVHADMYDTSIHHDRRPVSEKMSYRWIQALQAQKERVGDKRVVTVADREGDFFEFLNAHKELEQDFVIRLQHNRSLRDERSQPGQTIRDKLEQAPVLGSLDITIQNVDTRSLEQKRLEYKAIPVTIPVPRDAQQLRPKDDLLEPLSLNVVHVRGQDHEWMLLTSLPTTTTEEIQRIIEIYQARWHIEDYHKVLKTGYHIDEIYLHTSQEAIENLLTMASIAACRLYWLIFTGRSDPLLKADRLFETFEWKAIYVYLKESPPEEAPPLADVILKIARLGGYKEGKKTSPPGIKTMWLAFQIFFPIARMYHQMSTKT